VKFVDEAVITVESGNGGKGCVSFRREARVPRGGPDGGDGGRGGHVILTATARHNSLYPFQFKRHFKAKNGTPGQGKQKTGKNGADLTIEIPPGTLVREAETGRHLKDFDTPGDTLVVAAGGAGGRGNTHFKSSTHQAPKFAQPGEPGQILTLQLELKLIADAGIIGLPNAGKSTLIRAISAARPKVGDYPFTTLFPNLGVVETGDRLPFVVADIPGLIAGAHAGAGLGIRFLRHIERTRILVHLIDGSRIDPAAPRDAFETVNSELRLYNPELGRKRQIVAINKLDLPGVRERAEAFSKQAGGITVQCISARTGEGIEDLLSEIQRVLKDAKASEKHD